MFRFLVVALALLGAPAAFAQTAAGCSTAQPGSVWAAGAWLPCSTTPVYVAVPIATTAVVSDMRCSTSCVFSWQLAPNVLPSDQVWVKTAAKPSGTWVRASTLQFRTGPNPYDKCTTFLYHGTPFTLVTTMGSNSSSVTSPLTGSVTLAAPLPANGTITFAPTPMSYPPTVAGLVSWDFSSQVATLNSTDAAVYPFSGQPTFTFTTSNGVIVSWSFTVPYVHQFSSGNYLQYAITSTVNGDTVEATRVDASLLYPADLPTSITGSSSSPGAWTCQLTFTGNYP